MGEIGTGKDQVGSAQSSPVMDRENSIHRKKVLELQPLSKLQEKKWYEIGAFVFGPRTIKDKLAKKFRDISLENIYIKKKKFESDAFDLVIGHSPNNGESTSPTKKGTPRKLENFFVPFDKISSYDEVDESVLAVFMMNKIFQNTLSIEEAGLALAWTLYEEESEENGPWRQLRCLVFLDPTTVHETVAQGATMLPKLSKKDVPRTINYIVSTLHSERKAKAELVTTAMYETSSISDMVDRDFNTFYQVISEEQEKLKYLAETSADRKEIHVFPPNYKIAESKLRSKLKPYQKTTVRWMLNREHNYEIDFSRLLHSVEMSLQDPAYDCLKETLHYFPYLGIFTKSPHIQWENVQFKGGILADEMGLGKTVEVLSLIVTNPMNTPKLELEEHNDNEADETADPDEAMDEEDDNCSSSAQRENDRTDYLRSQMNQSLLDLSRKVDRSHGTAIIYTPSDEKWKEARKSNGKEVHEDTLITCTDCQTICVAEKCGWKQEFETIEPFKCPECFGNKPRVPIKTTLIIVPESLVQQWFDEITKHCKPGIEVMFYFGLNKQGYLHPYELAKKDIVLTTYDTMKNEFEFLEGGHRGSMSLRNRDDARHRFSPSSFLHVAWWRLIVDESQLVESSARRMPQMCARMESVSRWCVTGTPLVKNAQDIQGLLKFLSVWPLNVDTYWNMYVWPQWRLCSYHLNRLDEHNVYFDVSPSSCVPYVIEILAQIMWRNTKETVKGQLSLPELHQDEVVVQFTPIEERQYDSEKQKHRVNVLHALSGSRDEDLVNSLRRREDVMRALGKMKEGLISCGEHNLIPRGGNQKKHLFNEMIFGYETVQLTLIEKKKTAIEELARATMGHIHSHAGTALLIGSQIEAVHQYEKALILLDKLEDQNEYYEKNVNRPLAKEYGEGESIAKEEIDWSEEDEVLEDDDDKVLDEHPIITNARKNIKQSKKERKKKIKNDIKALQKLRLRKDMERKEKNKTSEIGNGHILTENETTNGEDSFVDETIEDEEEVETMDEMNDSTDSATKRKMKSIHHSDEVPSKRRKSQEDVTDYGQANLTTTKKEECSPTTSRDAMGISKRSEGTSDVPNCKQEDLSSAFASGQSDQAMSNAENGVADVTNSVIMKTKSELEQEELDRKAEREAQQIQEKLQRRADRPIRVDPTMHAHVFMNIRDLAYGTSPEINPEVRTLMREMMQKYGEEKLIRNYFKAMNRYCRSEIAGLKVVQAEFNHWNKEWDKVGYDEISLAISYFCEIANLHSQEDDGKNGKSLAEKMWESEKITALINEMPSNFLVSHPQFHRFYERHSLIYETMPMIGYPVHDTRLCNGSCDGIMYDDVKSDVPKATTMELLLKFADTLDCLEKKRQKVFNDAYLLFSLDLVSVDRTVKTTICEEVNIQSAIGENGQDEGQDQEQQMGRDGQPEGSGEGILNSKSADETESGEGSSNSMGSSQNGDKSSGSGSGQDEAEKMPVEERNRVMREIADCEHVAMGNKRSQVVWNTKLKRPCKLCELFVDIVRLQYEAGLASYHGDLRTKTPIYPFATLITNFERRSNCSLDSKQPMRNLRAYFDRLKRSLELLRGACGIFEELGYRMGELESAKGRLTLDQVYDGVRFEHPNGDEWKQREFARIAQRTKLDYELMISEMSNLRFLINADNVLECPVCYADMGETWVVYMCGHKSCHTCHVKMMGQPGTSSEHNGMMFIRCSTCRRQTSLANVLIVRPRDTENMDRAIPGHTLSVKLEATIKLLRRIMKEDDDNKIILFTTMETGTVIWRYITKVLRKAKIPFISAENRPHFARVMNSFGNTNTYKVLFVSLTQSANGLNLTKANNIVFLDPTHLNSVVQQAIGRINRYGQKREMFVYHMIVESSVDEKLRRIAKTDPSRREKGLTVGEVREMFGIESDELWRDGYEDGDGGGDDEAGEGGRLGPDREQGGGEGNGGNGNDGDNGGQEEGRQNGLDFVRGPVHEGRNEVGFVARIRQFGRYFNFGAGGGRDPVPVPVPVPEPEQRGQGQVERAIQDFMIRNPHPARLERIERQRPERMRVDEEGENGQGALPPPRPLPEDPLAFHEELAARGFLLLPRDLLRREGGGGQGALPPLQPRQDDQPAFPEQIFARGIQFPLPVQPQNADDQEPQLPPAEPQQLRVRARLIHLRGGDHEPLRQDAMNRGVVFVTIPDENLARLGVGVRPVVMPPDYRGRLRLIPQALPAADVLVRLNPWIVGRNEPQVPRGQQNQPVANVHGLIARERAYVQPLYRLAQGRVVQGQVRNLREVVHVELAHDNDFAPHPGNVDPFPDQREMIERLALLFLNRHWNGPSLRAAIAYIVHSVRGPLDGHQFGDRVSFMEELRRRVENFIEYDRAAIEILFAPGNERYRENQEYRHRGRRIADIMFGRVQIMFMPAGGQYAEAGQREMDRQREPGQRPRLEWEPLLLEPVNLGIPIQHMQAPFFGHRVVDRIRGLEERMGWGRGENQAEEGRVVNRLDELLLAEVAALRQRIDPLDGRAVEEQPNGVQPAADVVAGNENQPVQGVQGGQDALQVARAQAARIFRQRRAAPLQRLEQFRANVENEIQRQRRIMYGEERNERNKEWQEIRNKLKDFTRNYIRSRIEKEMADGRSIERVVAEHAWDTRLLQLALPDVEGEFPHDQFIVTQNDRIRDMQRADDEETDDILRNRVAISSLDSHKRTPGMLEKCAEERLKMMSKYLHTIHSRYICRNLTTENSFIPESRTNKPYGSKKKIERYHVRQRFMFDKDTNHENMTIAIEKREDSIRRLALEIADNYFPKDKRKLDNRRYILNRLPGAADDMLNLALGIQPRPPGDLLNANIGQGQRQRRGAALPQNRHDDRPWRAIPMQVPRVPRVAQAQQVHQLAPVAPPVQLVPPAQPVVIVPEEPMNEEELIQRDMVQELNEQRDHELAMALQRNLEPLLFDELVNQPAEQEEQEVEFEMGPLQPENVDNEEGQAVQQEPRGNVAVDVHVQANPGRLLGVEMVLPDRQIQRVAANIELQLPVEMNESHQEAQQQQDDQPEVENDGEEEAGAAGTRNAEEAV